MRQRVLLVDDQPTEIEWLIYRLHKRGYEVVLATNEKAALRELHALESGQVQYRAGIFDIMVAIDDLASLIEMDDEVDVGDILHQSLDTGVRLCRVARCDLELRESEFPIAAISVRDDDELRSSLEELGITLFKRDAQSQKSIMSFVDMYLPDTRSNADA